MWFVSSWSLSHTNIRLNYVCYNSRSGNSGGELHMNLYNVYLDLIFGNEFRLINDPDGIDNILKSFENFSVNNAAAAFERFEKFSILSTKINTINNEWRRIYQKILKK